jgi:hypothetical protein
MKKIGQCENIGKYLPKQKALHPKRHESVGTSTLCRYFNVYAAHSNVSAMTNK